MGPDGNLYIIGQSSNNIIKITDSNTATPTLSTISTTSQLGLGISDHIQSDILQPLDTANFQIICSSDSMSYHIEVDILNGVSPFTFTGLTGNFNNGTFVSDDIMNGDSYSLEISDALSCSNPISIDDSFICSTCFLSADIDVNDSTYCTSSFIDYPVWVVASGQSPYSLYYSIDNVSQPVIVSSSDSILVNITQDGLIEIDSLVDGACSLILADDFQINLEPEENAGIGTELIITNTDSSTFVLSDYVSGQSTNAGNWYDPDGNLLSLGAIDVVTAIEGDYYYVVNEDNLCPTDSTPVSVSVIEPLPLEVINIMNAFSPNGDGTNDIFSPFISNIIDPIEMYIYNRWGELIFYSNDSVSDGWDGMAHGKPAPIGAYAYILKTEEDLSIPKIYKGNVTLIR